MSLRHTLAAIAAASAFSIIGAGTALAGNSPSFAVQSAADTYIRGGYSAYERGAFKKAAVFSRRATAKGNKKTRRSIAYANLCAALGQQNQLDAALAACDSAIALNAKNWRAYNNRGVVEYRLGQSEKAAADFAAAAQAPKADLARANAALVSGPKLAASE